MFSFFVFICVQHRAVAPCRILYFSLRKSEIIDIIGIYFFGLQTLIFSPSKILEGVPVEGGSLTESTGKDCVAADMLSAAIEC